eukprot:g2370.t1
MATIKKKKKGGRSVSEANRLLMEHGIDQSGSGTQRIEEDEDLSKLGRFQKIKVLWKKHGSSFVGLYTTSWMALYMPIFMTLQYGGVDGIRLLDSVGAAEYFNYKWLSKDLINAYLAVELNALLEPIRLPVVLYATPKLSAFIQKKKNKQI